jgi:hypothetical protein
MAHDASVRSHRSTVEPGDPIAQPHLEWENPATSPFEVGDGGAHPLFVSGADRPLGWEPSTPHRLALPLSDRAGDGGLR